MLVGDEGAAAVRRANVTRGRTGAAAALGLDAARRTTGRAASLGADGGSDTGAGASTGSGTDAGAAIGSASGRSGAGVRARTSDAGSGEGGSGAAAGSLGGCEAEVGASGAGVCDRTTGGGAGPDGRAGLRASRDVPPERRPGGGAAGRSWDAAGVAGAAGAGVLGAGGLGATGGAAPCAGVRESRRLPPSDAFAAAGGASSGSRRAGPSRIWAPRITLRPSGRAGWEGGPGDAELGDGALGPGALEAGALGVDASDDGAPDCARFGIPPTTTSDRASARCGSPKTHSYAASLIPYISCSAGLGAGDAAVRLGA